MKIAFITNYELNVGGVAEVIYSLCQAYSNLGHQVTIVSDQPLPAAFNEYASYYYTALPKPKRIKQFSLINKIHHYLMKEEFDIIHAHGLYRAGYTAFTASKLRIPYVLTSHGDVLPGASQRIQRGSVKKRCREILKHASAVTHLLPHLQQASALLCNTENKNHIIPNGIDLAWFSDSKINSNTNPYLLNFGRLDPVKGQDITIRAYELLTKTVAMPPLVIAGSGNNEQTLWQLSQALQLPTFKITYPFSEKLQENSVYFCGAVPAREKRELYSSAKLVLFSPQYKNWEEAFGLIQLETMARKKMLVASDVAAARHLQSCFGFSFSLAKADQPESWANAILKCLNALPELSPMLEKNFELLTDFDWKKIAEKYLAVYQWCLLQKK